MYEIHEVSEIKTIYELILEITSNDSFFKKETIVITSNALLQEDIKKYIATKNEISYNLNFKKNIMKTIYSIAIKNKNIKNYLEQNTLLLYSETEKFILYNLLKNKEVNYIKEFKSIKNRYMYASKITNLFNKYYSKFSQIISKWRQNETLLKDSESKAEELKQKEIFKKLFEKQINIFDLYEKILSEKNNNKIEIDPKRIILIGEIREIDRKIFRSFTNIFNMQIYELRLKNIEEYNTPLVNELIKTKFKDDGELVYENEIKDNTKLLKEDSFLSSLKNKIIKNTPLASLDDSFKIIEAINKKREVEILINNIIYRTQTKSINLNEIAITGLENELNEYLPYLENLLMKYKIDYNNINLTNVSNSESVLALKSLLNLFISSKGNFSNFNKKEICTFILNKKVLKKFKITENETKNLIEFINLSNIVFSLNDEHKKMLEYENKFLNSWEDGFSRFLLSLVFDTNYDNAEGDLISLEKVEFQDKEQIIKLIGIVQSLYFDITYFIKKEYTVYEWAEIIEIFVKKYIELEIDNPADEFLKTRIKYLRNFSKDFNENLYKDYMESIKDKKIEFTLFKLMLEDSLEKKNFRNNGNKNGLLILPLRDLKYLDKKEIHFLGANKINIDIKSDGMDLLSEYYENVNIENENIKDFVQTMFFASEKFYIYYSNDPNDDLAKENKIIKKIASFIKKEKIDFETEKHPNEYYDIEYFKDNKPSFLVNYDKEMFRLAKNLNQNNFTKALNEDGVKIKNKLEITFKNIQNALENPYRHFYEHTLKVYIKDTKQEKILLEKKEEYYFIFKQKIFKELIYDYIKNETTEKEISEILDSKIINSIKSGVLSFEIKKDELIKDTLESFKQIKSTITIDDNFKDLLSAKKQNLTLDQKFNFQLENENLEIMLKGEIEDIYKKENDYFYVNFIKKDYDNTKDFNDTIELYIKGLFLKNEIKDMTSITLIKITNDGKIKALIKKKYKNEEIDLKDIENILKQYIYVSMCPSPVYRTTINNALNQLKENTELNFFSLLKELTKNPTQVYSSYSKSKSYEEYLMKTELSRCEYYKRFKDTHTTEINKNLLELLENFYLKFLN